MSRLPKSRRGPRASLTFVEWVDSFSTRGWNDPTSIDRKPQTCFSVGWLLDEDDKVVHLVASAGLNMRDGFDSVAGHMCIPKVAIIRRRVIGRGRK